MNEMRAAGAKPTDQVCRAETATSYIFFHAALILLIVLTACTSATTESDSTQDVLVTGEADGAPVGCSPEDIARDLAEMFAAISQGESGIVDKYFGRQEGASFAWYSISDSNGNFVAYTWEELDAYWQQRYRQHEQIHLRSVEFNGWDSARGLIHFGPIVISRNADDLGESDELVEGKGAYHCETQAVVVLSLVAQYLSLG